jgi:Tfp pilus assembly protein PilO
MGFLLSLFGSGAMSVIGKILPYVIAMLVVVGAYFYGHHQGTIACHEKELQAVIDVQNAKMVELQKQYTDTQTKIADLNSKNIAITDITKTVVQKIGQIPNPKGCEVGQNVIDLINQARTGSTGAKK